MLTVLRPVSEYNIERSGGSLSIMDWLAMFAAENPWMREGVCAQTDAAIFFPEPCASAGPAARVCRKCPVIDQCREYAIKKREQGVWGGTTDRQRQAIRQERAAAARRRAAAARKVAA